MIPSTYNFMGIPEAWRIATGSGRTVGLTDTGIYYTGEQMTTNVRAGHSANRFVTYTNTTNYAEPYIADDACSHGPRMAGVIAAPRDNSGPVGVAWGANFVSVRHNDDVTVFDAYYATQAINLAGSNGSDIIVMAWGAADVWFSSIEDAIKYWHYNFGRLFVGAAGSTGVCIDYLLRNNTFFPAEIPEVIAVTGVDDDGRLACNVMHGPGVDLAAHIDQVTTGRYSDVVTIMASSNAAGVVGGMAALVWNRYPTMSRDQVRQRLESMASYGLSGNKDGDIGYGIVNAYRAVGGFYDLRIDGPTCLGAYEADEVTLTAMPYGDGPFTYKWHDGQTGKSATFLAPAPGETAEYLVYVTDGLEGKTRSRAHYVEKLPTTDTRLMC
jgi:serine protease